MSDTQSKPEHLKGITFLPQLTRASADAAEIETRLYNLLSLSKDLRVESSAKLEILLTLGECMNSITTFQSQLEKVEELFQSALPA